MNKINRKQMLLSCSLFLLSPHTSFAAEGQDAGAVLSKNSSVPFATLEPQKDLTGFFDYNKPKEKQPLEKQDNDTYFSADEIENNDELQIITAKGGVNIIRENITLKADKVIYNQKEDIINAVGNVVLVEENGNVIFSDYIELTNQMSQGEMRNIKLIMKDLTRLSAKRVRRMNNDKKVMDYAVYSPCDACKNEDPLWQLKARKVTHDAKKQDIYYKDATIEIKGVPVFYTPFLSHPDPEVKRRSGFLAPKISSNSYLGATLQPNYFWDISENEDMTISPILSSDQGIVWGGTYNRYFYNGEVSANGTFMGDKDDDGSHRGSLFLKGRYEVNDYWVADTDINYASDSTYLKDLSLPKKDDAWLTSMARLQGFDNRNYASLETYYYKLLSNDIRQHDKPYVLPLFDYENISDPQKYGAYTKTILNFASVQREEDTSTQRATMINSWNLPYTSPFGEKYKLSASVKSDLYYIDNYDTPDNENFDGVTGRIFPQLGLEWRLPFVRATENSRQILEPVVLGVLAPNQDNKIDKIPNEDSQDVELDDTNILDLDRYAGYDRNDTGSRISYGVNWSAYGDQFGRTSMFLAQSYKFDNEEGFSDSLGQTGYFSDYVGRAYAAPSEYFDLNYRFKLDKDSYDLTYSELSSQIGPKILNAYVSYIFLQKNALSSIQDYENRKELYTSLNAAISKDWSVSIFNRQDLSQYKGSLEHGGSLIYEDECLKLITSLRKDNSNDPEYKGDFEISVTFLLKTIGGAGSK